MMVIYNSFYEYIVDNNVKRTRIQKMDEILDALQDTLLKLSLDGDVQEYHFNNGQSVVRAIYRDPAKILEAMKLLRVERNALINAGNRTCVIKHKRSYKM